MWANARPSRERLTERMINGISDYRAYQWNDLEGLMFLRAHLRSITRPGRGFFGRWKALETKEKIYKT